MLRDGLRAILRGEPDLWVAGEAVSLEAALSIVEDPNVLITGTTLPDARGPAIVAALRDRFPHSAVLVLTTQRSPVDISAAFEAGARGYLFLDAHGSELMEAIRRVAAGDVYLQSSLGAAKPRSPLPRSGGVEVSRKEQQVLTLLALGHTNREIARILGVSLRTAESHRAHLQQKLGVRTRAELARYARSVGLIDGSD